MVTKGWGGEGGWNGELLFHGYSFSLDDEKVFPDGCTTVNIINDTELYTC